MVANVDLHKVEVSNVVLSKYSTIDGYERDEVDYDGFIIHCPKDETCAVWRECRDCDITEDEYYEAIEDEGIWKHGKWHADTEEGIAVKDEPHNCGVGFLTEWDQLVEAIHEHGAGIYTFKVDYDGDWVAYDFKKEGEDGQEEQG